MKQFANMLEPLKTQLNDINEKISDLQQQISMANIIQLSVIKISDSDKVERKPGDDKNNLEKMTMGENLKECCFGKDTQIKLANGTQKKASDIREGEVLVNFEEKHIKVSNILTGHDRTIYHIITDKGSTKVSESHPFMMHGGKCVVASRLKPGDILSMDGGQTAKAEEVKIIPYNDVVYNFTFDESSAYGTYIIADGFFSGDFYMQNRVHEPPAHGLSDRDKALLEEARRFAEMMNSRNSQP